jgi:hypothetical protein
MRNCIQLRYKFMPYLYTLAYNATQTGEPMNTPTVFQFYGDQNTASLNDYEFMVGDSLLAAPVYNQGDTTRTVYLPWSPSVGWYHWWTGTRYAGGNTVTVGAPLGQLPMFVRSDAIIPMGPSMQYTTQFQPGYLDINCWPETSSSFTLYEDEGEGWNYTNGVRAATTFTSTRSVSNWDFAISARQGSYNPGRTNYYVYVYNPATVQDVKVNGSLITQASSFSSPAPCWLMTSDGKLGIKVTDAGTTQAIHVDWNSSSPYSSMSVAATFNNWNAGTNNMQSVGGRNWQYDTTFNNLGNFEFKFAANANWTVNWGENSGSQAQFSAPLSGTGKPGGADNILVNGSFNGLYRFAFNDQTLTYSVTPLLASPYATMTVAGNFNGWNPAANNMQLIANNTWQYDAALSTATNVQFKFAANGNWTNNWGNSNQTAFSPPLSGTGDSYGANVQANGPLSGSFRFTFNDQTLAYTMQSIGPIITTHPPVLTGCNTLASGALHFTFTNTPGTSFTVLGATNVLVPLSNWAVLGSLTDSPPGQFQFTDPQATNRGTRFYRVRSP